MLVMNERMNEYSTPQLFGTNHKMDLSDDKQMPNSSRQAVRNTTIVDMFRDVF